MSSDIKEEEDESITRSNEQAMALIGSRLNREYKYVSRRMYISTSNLVKIRVDIRKQNIV